MYPASFTLGACRFGNECAFKHTGSSPAAPAGESRGRSKSRGRRGKKKASESAPAAACISVLAATGEASLCDHRRVRFAKKPQRYTFIVDDDVLLQPVPSVQVRSRPEQKGNKPSPEAALARALKGAKALCKEIGIPFRTVAAPATAAFIGPRRWLVDTGSAFDLVGRKDVPERFMSFVEPARQPVKLKTANGSTTVDEEITLQCGPLREHVHPLLLESSPAVLSVGRR